MLVFGDGELRPHSCRERVQRIKGGLASIMKFTSFSPADQEHGNTVQVVELVLENHQDTIQDWELISL
jgi:hypothetical protein